ncbi:MAG: carboxypeptidase regulatory-like domain-containing protein, partial [Gemmatimonadaceae bacterium]|nr:carboxypeptidase regulatory-like domain-containing protein [Gemmatimonadaceae bacterium]
MPRQSRWPFFIALIGLVWPSLAAAQAPASATVARGTVRGTVYDSLGQAPLVGATVELASPARTVVTDARGNFVIDSVPVGVQRFSFSAPDLDSIGFFGFAREIDVRAGDQRVTLATPSFGTLYRSLCAPSVEVTSDSAIMFGTVYDARSRAPVKRATVNFAWFAVDTLVGTRVVEMLRQASTDESGTYGRCGLPADMALRTLATDSLASSGPISRVIGTARIFRQDFYISSELVPDSTRTPPRGTGVVRGTVRDERGGPLLNALVVLLASDRTARTDSLGRYRFTDVPLGTQELSVRQVGRGALYRLIDVIDNEPVDASFTLPTVTVLAAMNVRGARRPGTDQAAYLTRKKYGFGRYLEAAEIAKRGDVPSALSRLPGLSIQQNGRGLSIMNQRQSCQPILVIDGFPGTSLARETTVPVAGMAGGRMPSTTEMRIESM